MRKLLGTFVLFLCIMMTAPIYADLQDENFHYVDFHGFSLPIYDGFKPNNYDGYDSIRFTYQQGDQEIELLVLYYQETFHGSGYEQMSTEEIFELAQKSSTSTVSFDDIGEICKGTWNRRFYVDSTIEGDGIEHARNYYLFQDEEFIIIEWLEKDYIRNEKALNQMVNNIHYENEKNLENEIDASAKDYTFIRKKDRTIDIYSYIGENVSEVVIPDEIDGYKVTGIRDTTTMTWPSYMTSIKIPDSVSDIVNPFMLFPYVRIIVSPENEYLCMIDDVLYSKPDKRLVRCVNSDEIIEIPSGIKEIENSAFFHCRDLKNVTLPESVQSIGWAAFSNCDELTSINIPEGITKIEGVTFLKCHNLRSVVLPATLESIDNSAFADCENLTEITIPKAVESIGTDVFRGCDELTIVVERNSYASEYCKENDLNYVYPDSYDWLND